MEDFREKARLRVSDFKQFIGSLDDAIPVFADIDGQALRQKDVWGRQIGNVRYAYLTLVYIGKTRLWKYEIAHRDNWKDFISLEAPKKVLADYKSNNETVTDTVKQWLDSLNWQQVLMLKISKYKKVL